MRAVICRKATFTVSVSAVMLSDATSPSPRAQNRGFCAFLAFGTTIFGRFEHKIGLFVREEVCCELCLDICLLITVLDEVCKWLLYMIGGDVRREYD